MQISNIKNRIFEKFFRNPSNRTQVKILKKKFFWDISPKKLGSAYAQSPRKCSNLEILAKIEGKEAKFVSKIYQGLTLPLTSQPLTNLYKWERKPRKKKLILRFWNTAAYIAEHYLHSAHWPKFPVDYAP